MVTISEVAERLGVSVSAVENWLRYGIQIPFYQLGGVGRVFDIAEVLEWYDKATKGGTQGVQFPTFAKTPPKAVIPNDGLWHPNGSRVYGDRKF